jgi:hypothetical protein
MSTNNQINQDPENKSISYIHKQKIEKKMALKKKNNSFYMNDSIPIKINQLNINNDQECNNDTIQTFPANTYNNNFTFHKKTLSSINYKGTLTTNDNNNNNICDDNKDNTLNNRIMVKKRPLKENSNTEAIDINSKKNLKIKNNNLCICSDINYNFISNKNNKIVFENENEIIEYINNKFEEDKKKNNDKKLKYTGFILTKKYKGKILHEIRIDENIKKINEKLREEKVKINNDFIEINPLNTKDELDNLKNIIINKEKELSKLKKENESIVKKDFLKNELINKLDKEKQNILEENEKLNKELEKIKKINDNKYNELKLIIDKNKIENIMKNYKIENLQILTLKSMPKTKMFDINKLKEVKIEINTIQKNIGNSNNLSVNFNGYNGALGQDTKKTNQMSVVVLTKISEIKDIKIDNIENVDKEIKANLDLLNEKNNNVLKDNKNNAEVESFNEN